MAWPPEDCESDDLVDSFVPFPSSSSSASTKHPEEAEDNFGKRHVYDCDANNVPFLHPCDAVPTIKETIESQRATSADSTDVGRIDHSIDAHVMESMYSDYGNHRSGMTIGTTSSSSGVFGEFDDIPVSQADHPSGNPVNHAFSESVQEDNPRAIALLHNLQKRVSQQSEDIHQISRSMHDLSEKVDQMMKILLRGYPAGVGDKASLDNAGLGGSGRGHMVPPPVPKGSSSSAAAGLAGRSSDPLESRRRGLLDKERRLREEERLEAEQRRQEEERKRRAEEEKKRIEEERIRAEERKRKAALDAKRKDIMSNLMAGSGGPNRSSLFGDESDGKPKAGLFDD